MILSQYSKKTAFAQVLFAAASCVFSCIAPATLFGQDTGVSSATFVQPQKTTLAKRNYDRQTIVAYWRNQLTRNETPTYPTLWFDQDAAVGDVGIGDSSIVFTIVQKLPNKNQLATISRKTVGGAAKRAPENLFQLQGAKFADLPVGSRVSATSLCEITGVRKFKDKQKRIQKALIVSVIKKSDLELPIGKLPKGLVVAEPVDPIKPLIESTKPKVAEKATSKNADPEDGQPKFKVRRWMTRDGDRSIAGKLVGVGSKAVWIKIATGKVIRVEIDKLHPTDRDHALEMKQAILDYRSQNK